MKDKELKIFWKLARRFWIGGFVLWFFETLVFLIIEGWHVKASHPIEIYLDKTVHGMWNFALWLTVITSIYYIINLNKKL